MDARFPFSAAAAALAEASLETAIAPGQWTAKKHRYARIASQRLRLRRSEDGGWGVVRNRIYGAAQTELFVARMAVYAGVPVAPTFVTSARKNAPMLSVIPFANMVYSTELPYANMAEFLRHTSSCLPFFLWMGQDMDRAYRNICMNADNPASFAEFDFENTSLANVFRTTSIDASVLNRGLRDVYEMSYNSAVVDGASKLDLDDQFIQKPILREAFAEGLARLRTVPDTAVDNVLDVVNQAREVSERQRRAVKGYLAMRLFTLEISYRTGRLDRHLVESLPEKTGIPAPAFQPFTYRFE